MEAIIYTVIIVTFVVIIIFKQKIFGNCRFQNLSEEQMIKLINSDKLKFNAKNLIAILQRDNYQEMHALFLTCIMRGIAFNEEVQKQLAKCLDKDLLLLIDCFPERMDQLPCFQKQILVSRNSTIIRALFQKVAILENGAQSAIVDCDYDLFCNYLNLRRAHFSVCFRKRLIDTKDVAKIRYFIKKVSLGGVLDIDFIQMVNQRILTDNDLVLYLNNYGQQLSMAATVEIYKRCEPEEIKMTNQHSLKDKSFWYGLMEIGTETLMFLLEKQIVVIPKKYQNILIMREVHEEIMFLIETGIKLLDVSEVLLIERNNEVEIEAYKAKGHRLSFVANGLEEIRLSKQA